jgi:hypothetical protein
VVNVRADGIAVVLGPLLRDVRIVAAALVDVDSGMVLDAWSAGGSATGSPDLELIGAQHAEILRCALEVLRTWCGAAGAAEACEVVLGADGGVRHLLRTVPDPHGDRLALAVVVDGPQRVLDRVRRRLQTVSVDALTAGPSMIRRPSGGGWSFDPPGPDVPAQPEPGAGLLPPGAGARRAPGPGVPLPREGRPVPGPGVPSPRDPRPTGPGAGRAAAGHEGRPVVGPAAGAAGVVPAMAGLRPAPPVAEPPPDPVGAASPEPGADGVPAADSRAAEPGIAPATSAPRLARRPMLFSVAGGDADPRTVGGDDPAAGSVTDAPPRPPARPATARPPSPPAALPAPARRRPPQP